MRIRLSRAWQRWTLLAVVLVAGVLYSLIATRMVLAERYSKTSDRAQLVRAADLEPLNATHPYRLARSAFVEDLDAPKAIAYYQHAVALDPYTSHYWLDLAVAYNAAGNTAGMRTAIDRALATDPHTPENLWRASNLLILSGDNRAGFAVLRDLIGPRPEYASDAINLAWRASGDVDEVLSQVVPQQPAAQFAFLTKMIEEKRAHDASRTWNTILAGHQAFQAKDAFPYVEFLLSQNDGESARQAWNDIAKVDTSFAPYATGSELVVNGGFELPVIDRGLGWRHEFRPGVTLDTLGEPHGGKQSLSIHLEGSPPDAGLEQWVPVVPGSIYAVHALYKGNVIGVSAPRLAVITPAGERLMLSDEMRGSPSWLEVGGVFSTGPGQSVVILRVTREPGSTQLRGSLLLDDVSITRDK